jgi:hypothetical protein
MREQLLGYLIGALEDAERDEVERRLADDPRWQRELVTLQARLEPLAETCEEFEPPADLVDRTCDLIENHAEQRPVSLARSILARSMATFGPPTSRWTMADCVVAAGVCLVAALVFLPAIMNSRYIAQVDACQDNLRQIGMALSEYSDKAGVGFFPAVPREGNRAFAGVYAPVLIDNGYLVEPRVVLCPSSALASQLIDFRVPTLVEIDNADEQSVAGMKQVAGGSYGYSLGVVINGEHRAPRNRGREFFALMSDMPTGPVANTASINHAGRGWNMLYESGRVQYLVAGSVNHNQDDPFRNLRGVVEAGLGEDDAVIGSSGSPPFQTIGTKY